MRGSSDDLATAGTLFEFVCAFLADAERDAVGSLESYLARFPGHEEALRAEYRRLIEADSDGAPDDLAALPRDLGRYRLLEPLGSGGQGTVFLAEDRELSRRVAIKILAPHLDFVSSERRARFVREATLLAQLDHPAICQVYAAETTELGAYIAMRYVAGESLAQVLRGQRERGDLPRTRAQIHVVLRQFEIVARALQEAHEAGVIHRDIKPGNLMIGTDGNPVILDFGLGRARDDALDAITRTGDVLGTLPYMAPELLSGSLADASPQSDVYSLGVTLFQTLTHRLPFASPTHAGLVGEITAGLNVDPRRHNAAVPMELGLVVAGALALERSRRYRDARSLADDLLRVCRREAVLVRPPPRWLRALRWVQRHPTISVGVGAMLALLLLLALGLQRVRSKERAARAMHRALEASTSDEGAGLALEELIEVAATETSPDLLGAIARVLDASQLDWQRTRTAVPLNHVDPPPTLSRDGRYVAQADSRGDLELIDAASGALIARRHQEGGATTAVGFLDSGELLCATHGQSLVLTVPGLAPRVAPALENPVLRSVGVHSFAQSLDGSCVALGTKNSVYLTDARLERVETRIAIEDPTPIRRLEFSPNGRWLAMLGKSQGEDLDADDVLWVVDTIEGKVLHQRHFPLDEIVCFAWSPDSTRFAVGGNSGTLEVVDLPSFTTSLRRSVSQAILWTGFARDGGSVLLPTEGRTEFWSCREPSTMPLRILPHPSGRTIAAAGFDPSGRYFAAVHRDGTVQLLETADWRLLRRFQQRMINVRYLEWSPDGAGLLTADMTRLLAWHVLERAHAGEIWAHQDAVSALLVLPASDASGARLVSTALDGTLHACDLPFGRARRRSALGPPILSAAAAGDDILVLRGEATIERYGVHDLSPHDSLTEHAAKVLGLLVANDGESVVSYAEDGEAILWGLPEFSVRHRWQTGTSPVRSAAFDSRGESIAFGNAAAEFAVFDVRSGQTVHRARAVDAVVDWRINPFYQVRGICHEAATGQWCLSLVNVAFVRFDPNRGWERQNTWLQRFGGAVVEARAAASLLCADYSFGWLSILTDERVEPLRVGEHEAHRNKITALLSASGGSSALSTALDGRAIHWNLATRRADLLREESAPITTAIFGPSESTVILGLSDGRVRILPSDPLATAIAVTRARRLQGK